MNTPKRSCLPALRQSVIFDVRIASVDMNSFSAGLYLADSHYIVPPVKDAQYLEVDPVL